MSFPEMPPHWATHVLKHIPTCILFYSNTGDLTQFNKLVVRLQPLANQPAYNLYGHSIPGAIYDWEVVKPITPDIYRMLTEQSPERRSKLRTADDVLAFDTPAFLNEIEKIEEQDNASLRKPVTSFDWELSQAIIHLKNAASVTDSNRAHLLLSAVQIAKGVRESE